MSALSLLHLSSTKALFSTIDTDYFRRVARYSVATLGGFAKDCSEDHATGRIDNHEDGNCSLERIVGHQQLVRITTEIPVAEVAARFGIARSTLYRTILPPDSSDDRKAVLPALKPGFTRP
jgi:hypothetical protein